MKGHNRFKAYLVFTFTICYIASFLYVSAGTGDQTDLDISVSQAGFVGEFANDTAGTHCDIVGDVNGDGYDDILISTWVNSESGRLAGQTYLIFGKETGWEKDLHLSNADASFLGEAANDLSGVSIAGAGDVNGDGYDDILISSPYSSDAGNETGQIYLIFGKATGWNMDTNLSNADASFVGEVNYDRAGRFIDGAGDVNGDGYYDFIIGVSGNDENGRNTGQVYLVFGKPSGWSMETDLSSSNASFLGEVAGDGAGGRVAGCGDVNGDGFDDILIGALENQEGGHRSGQTYLVLGKRNGWSMDVPLSMAQASFIGEKAGDVSGYSLAGAGDVNRDGFDDLLVGAIENRDVINRGGQVYLILGKDSGWSMDTDLTDSDASFYGEEMGDEAGKSVSGMGDVNDDGYDDFLIGAPYFETGGNSLQGQVYLILGRASGWTMDNNLSASNASFIGKHGDQVGISLSGGGDTNGDGFPDILIGAAGHNAGTGNEGKTYLIFYDYTPPSLDGDLTPSTATTGDEFTFNITASDDKSLRDVIIEYWYGNETAHANKTASLSSGDERYGTYLLNITTRVSPVDNISYRVHVVDDFRHAVSSMVREVTLIDNDPPLMSDRTPSLIYTGQVLEFLALVEDYHGVESVTVEYWYGDGSTHTIEPMVRDANATIPWRYWITIPTDFIGSLNYILSASDLSGNVRVMRYLSVHVLDGIPPVFGTDDTDSSATTGDNLTFKVNVDDNIGVHRVRVEHWYGDAGAHINTSMTEVSTGKWSLNITIPSGSLDTLHYFFSAADSKPNRAKMDGRDILVVDNDVPYLVADMTEGSVTTGDTITISIEADDNIRVNSVSVVYWSEGDESNSQEGPMTEWPPGTWSFTITVPNDRTDLLKYQLNISDMAKNVLTTSIRNITVMDDEAPWLGEYSDPATVLKGSELQLEIEASDNIGVDEVHLEYWFGSGEHEVLSMSGEPYSFTVEVPRRPSGDVHFFFTVLDAADNRNSSTERTIVPINLPPEVGDLPTWDVVEGTDAEYDLAPYISDPNDVNFRVSYSDVRLKEGGLVLKIRHDTVVPDRTVVLRISDGDDEVRANLTIHVVNINDAPVMSKLFPANGTMYKEGEKVTLSVTTEDEEDDELTVTWWDGETELGTGPLLEVKLKPGEHVIRVVVDDGTDQVEESFTVIVKKDEPSPGFGLVAGLAAVVLAGLVIHRRRR